MTDEDKNVTELPVDVDLDLDSEVREEKEPYRVRVGGKVVSMVDPETIDWQDLLDIEDPIGFLRYCISDEDRDHIFSLGMPGWKLGKLMDGYMRHFELDEKMRQFQRAQKRGF